MAWLADKNPHRSRTAAVLERRLYCLWNPIWMYASCSECCWRKTGALWTHVVASQALRAVAEKNFDFVITAHGAPGIDGLLLLDALRERGSAIPSVVISSRHEKEPYLLAMSLAALYYFIKPLDYAALQRLIHHRA